MNNEEFLLNTIKGTAHWIELQIESIKNYPKDAVIAGFDDGKICGFSRALEGINTSLHLYQRKVDGEE